MKTIQQIQSDRKFFATATIVLFLIWMFYGPAKRSLYETFQMPEEMRISELNKYKVVESFKTVPYFVKAHEGDSLRAIEWRKNHFKK